MKQANFIHKLTKEYNKLDIQNLPKVRALLNKLYRVHLDELSDSARADMEDMLDDLEQILFLAEDDNVGVLQEAWYDQWK